MKNSLDSYIFLIGHFMFFFSIILNVSTSMSRIFFVLNYYIFRLDLDLEYLFLNVKLIYN